VRRDIAQLGAGRRLGERTQHRVGRHHAEQVPRQAGVAREALGGRRDAADAGVA